MPLSQPVTLPALLAAVAVITEWQQARADMISLGAPQDVILQRMGRLQRAEQALLLVDTSTLTSAAHQHAEALRQEADEGDVGQGIASSVVRAAADFLDGEQT